MMYRFHDYSLNPASRELWHGAQRLALEPKVLQVLLYLLEHRDRVVPKDELLAQCWPETYVSESALMRCLARLRKAVPAPPAAPPVIETRHRQGYRFVAAVTVCSQPSFPALGDPAPPGRPGLQAATHPEPQVLPEPSVPSAPLCSAPLSAPAPARPAASGGAERRQLTVLCCDVVDSTTLAGQLDPEDFCDVMERYHAACTAVIQRYGGHVAQYLGDRLLAYFGWPQAHEDAARRAVYAALVLVTAIRDLGTGLLQDYGHCLAIRMGLHTGLVVVGGGAGDPLYSQLAIGATPHLATKIQGLAAPETVVISAATHALVQGFFVCEPLGDYALPGLPAPSALYHVRGVSGARGRLDIAMSQQLTPFVGREAELAVLRERLAHLRQGLGQVVLLQGDAGMGKSRLVQQVKTALVAEGFTCIEYWGSPYAQHTALHPVVEWLQGCLHGDDASEPTPLARLEALVQQAGLDLPEHLPRLAALVSLDLHEARYQALQLTPQRLRQRTLETLVALVIGLAVQQPVCVLVEDLHWLDPTTLEWLDLLMAQGPTAPLFTLLTCRPSFVSPWGGRTHLTPLTIPRLTPQQVTQMVEWLGGDRLSAAHVQHIVALTDGVPLFVEEVTRFVLAAQRLQGHPSHGASGNTAPETAIPATLRDALMARLDQLGPAKGTAQLGAVIGREFSYTLLQAVTPLDADRLYQDLQQLVETELLYQRGAGASATYLFKHTLIQEAAYASLLRRTQQQYHRHIAQVLESQLPETMATHPEVLARHYTAAALPAQALSYWQQAAQRASERSAHVEVIAFLEHGRAALACLPAAAARDKHELELHLALGAPLIATRGWAAPEVEQVYARALVLCQQLGDSPQRFAGLFGLFTFSLVRGEVQTARMRAEDCRQLAQRLHDPGLLLEADTALGAALFYLGEWESARTFLEEGRTLYDPQQHGAHAWHYGQDPRVVGHAFAAWVLWFQGYPDQAIARAHEAIRCARQLAHPFSLALALNLAAVVHHLCRDAPTTTARAEAAMTLATEHGFAHWQGAGMMFRGWAVAQHGHSHEEGTVQLRQGLEAWHATGAQVLDPYWLALLAETYGRGGQTAAGLQTVEDGLAVVHHTAQHFYAAELYRLQGELLLQHATPDAVQAENCFHQALAIARHQQARSLELRAALSLARLWQQQGKRAKASALLAPIYGWFTEGFDTADLQDARALLER
jgi:class 3 adenylate cyclase/predicted ATPase/DNA-binding winged helix-turn-helix (wHTH) protein